MDEISVYLDQRDGICVIWTYRLDSHNRPVHERIQICTDQIPDLIQKLQRLQGSIVPHYH